MNAVTFYSQEDLLKLVKKRAGEKKFGESLSTIRSWDQLKTSSAKYVLFGIPEDIGVLANYGHPGTAGAWQAALTVLCNIQNNYLTQSQDITVLGEISCEAEMRAASRLSSKDEHYLKKLGELVSQIDEKVAITIQHILAADKFPIVIGGGHNNSYGNLKGAFHTYGKAINCLNFDAHTDFRALEHRHSGNGFSYAFEHGFLNRYFTFGLHRNYTSQFVFDRLQKYPNRIQFSLFEDIMINGSSNFEMATQEAEEFMGDALFGLELDLDALEDMGSSAMTPGGFSIHKARSFVTLFSKKKNCVYLHICEGAPGLGSFPAQVGKTISFLISDVIA